MEYNIQFRRAQPRPGLGLYVHMSVPQKEGRVELEIESGAQGGLVALVGLEDLESMGGIRWESCLAPRASLNVTGHAGFSISSTVR